MYKKVLFIVLQHTSVPNLYRYAFDPDRGLTFKAAGPWEHGQPAESGEAFLSVRLLIDFSLDPRFSHQCMSLHLVPSNFPPRARPLTGTQSNRLRTTKKLETVHHDSSAPDGHFIYM